MYTLNIEKITSFETKINAEIAKCKEILELEHQNDKPLQAVMRRISNVMSYYDRLTTVMNHSDEDIYDDSDEYNYGLPSDDSINKQYFDRLYESDEIDFDNLYEDDSKKIDIYDIDDDNDRKYDYMESKIDIFKEIYMNPEIEFDENIDKNIYDEPSFF